MVPLFEIGNIYASKNVSERIDKDFEFAVFTKDCLRRYCMCDWGDDGSYRSSNEYALRNNGRIIAFYKYKSSDTIIITTEPERSSTVFMFDNEY